MVSIGIVFHVKKLNSKCNKAFVLIENIMNDAVSRPETLDLGVITNFPWFSGATKAVYTNKLYFNGLWILFMQNCFKAYRAVIVKVHCTANICTTKISFINKVHRTAIF